MSYTKAQLLDYFQGLDTSTLERLRKYSEYMIIPDEDTLVNATMIQMVEKAHSLADSLFPEWTDRSKSDFGEFLIQLFAFFSEKDFWYINAMAKEGVLRKMKLYSNAFTTACMLGYTPTLCKGSKALFKLRFSAGDTVTYGKGELVVSVGTLHFTNTDAFVVRISSEDADVSLELTEGKIVAEDVTYNGNNIFLRKENIDIDSIVVVIDNITYTRVGYFGASSPSSTHYMVLPEEDGSCSIYFGSNGYGIQPSLGKTIHVEYLTCSGSNGNVKKDDARISESLPEREVVSVSMEDASTGGTDPESLTSIKETAPMIFHSNRTAVNAAVSEEILKSYPFVHKAKVTSISNEVVYMVIPKSGAREPSASERKYIEDNFFPLLMIGYEGNYVPNRYVDIVRKADIYAENIVLDLVVLKGYDFSKIESSVRQLMTEFTDPLVGADYGNPFNKNAAEITMRARVKGLQGVTFNISFADGTETSMPDVVLEKTEIFSPINQDKLIVRINAV